MHLQRVEARDRDTLYPIMMEHIVPGSTIYSDDARVYATFNRNEFVHSTVNHTEMFVAPDGTGTNNIERMWGEVKAELKIIRGTNDVMITAHLDEFCFRKINHGEHIFDLMLRLISHQCSCN